jgi:hypothetical protein
LWRKGQNHQQSASGSHTKSEKLIAFADSDPASRTPGFGKASPRYGFEISASINVHENHDAT